MSEAVEAHRRLPLVALVGRPNVGKSRLFNRLVGRRISIVHDQPGVTRDLITAEVDDGRYTLMDTGGIGLYKAELTPKVVADAWTYFNDVQTKTIKYKPFIAPTDQPAIWLNADKMAKYRDEMKKYYYDPTKYDTYLQQLGIKYPTVRGIMP